MKIKNIEINKRYLYMRLINMFQYRQIDTFQIAIREKDMLINNIAMKVYVC